MMRKNFNRKVSFLTALTLLGSSVAMTGCARTKESKGEITVICKSKVQFFDYVEAGAKDCGDEMGYTIHYEETNNDTELSAQIEMIEEAIERKTMAIVIAPNDVSGLNPYLSKAIAAGIPVITIDSDVTFEDRLAYIGSDNQSAGSIAGRAVKEFLPDGGQIAIVGHIENSQTAIERIKGFKMELEDEIVKEDIKVKDDGNSQKITQISEEKYPIKKIEYCDNEIEKAIEKTKIILTSNPNIKLIYGTNENSTTGICEAIEEMGKSDTVKVIGFNASEKEISYINHGTLTGTIVQNPYNMGYLGVRYAIYAVTNQKDNLHAELITSVDLVTADNLDDEDIKFLINPASVK